MKELSYLSLTPPVCKGLKVGNEVKQKTLTGLMEGTYNICVMAHTAVGGATGPCQMVVVGKNDHSWIDLFFFLILACINTALSLNVFVCVHRA